MAFPVRPPVSSAVFFRSFLGSGLPSLGKPKPPIQFAEKYQRRRNVILETMEHSPRTGQHEERVCVMTKFVAFLKNESGATAIEYGLIAAGISVAIIAIVNGLGTQLNTTFSSISTQLK
jgi:pilus assembly protein Flp/PilA